MRKLLLLSVVTLFTNKIDAQCLPAINNETISVSQSTICSGKSTTITTSASLPGVKYSLRDDATNAVVAGPTNGTGTALSFNTGTLTSNKTFNVYAETQPGGNIALDFDGSNDMIYTNTYSSATNSLTLEAWIYPRATTYKRFISNFDGTNSPGEFGFDNANATNNRRGLRFFVIGPTSTSHSVTIANVLTLNAWNHVAGTFDNGVMKIYVNGIAVATSTAPFTSIPSNPNEITIGEDPLIVVQEYFNGMMDDIRIWNTARTATEISGNMNNCLIGNESGLKNYFKLFENSGNKILDIVTNSIGTMSSGMTASSAWTTGNVNCGNTTCNFEMTNLKTVTVSPNPTITVNSGSICSGKSFTITPSGANTYTIQGVFAVKTPTANASYTVVGTSSVGCVSSTFATSSVTVNSLPTINATTSNSSICVGETANLNANGASTYTWNPGGIGSSISVSPVATTNYSVTGTDVNGCENNAVVTQTVNLCAGINQLTNSNNAMTLFPNPSSSILTIQTTEEIKAVYIFNTLGDLVRTENTNTFSVEQLSSGIYMIHVKTEKGINTLRFIRE
jgi:hypothetical protein